MVVGELPEQVELLVIGGGPGGYAAAFHAAEKGLDVTLVTDEEELGGVCLLRGCIPSKALLHVSELIHATREAGTMGVRFGKPDLDLEKLRQWKESLIGKLTGGLAKLAERRGVKLVHGRARFISRDTVRLDGARSATLKFKHAIIATGSRPSSLPDMSLEDERIMDSRAALQLANIPESLLVIGGGYIGLELGQVYATLGSRVTLVERDDRILSGADADLTKQLAGATEEMFEAIHLESKVTALEAADTELKATIETASKSREMAYDKALVCVGRRPNTDDLGLHETKVETDEAGYIVVDEQRRTADRRIFAIGDAAGGMLLAHEAMHEGRVAAEVIAGEPAAFDVRAIPAIVYTDPQIAWCGLTESAAERAGREIKVVRFPWSASGRALSAGVRRGTTKLIVDRNDGRVLGMGAVGRGAEGLVAEATFAIEMGATAEDLALTVHAHPTLSETIGEAAALYFGDAIHIA